MHERWRWTLATILLLRAAAGALAQENVRALERELGDVGQPAAQSDAAAERPVSAGPAPEPAGPSWRGAIWPEQWRRDFPRSPALDVPSPITHDDQTQRVTLREAIAIAVENNPGIAARRLEPARLGTNVLETQAQYDPTFAGELEALRSITPNASALSGTRTNVIDQRNANFHLSKLFRSSTRLNLDFLNERLDNNATYISLRPSYNPELGFSLVQPLLRDLGWDFTYLVVRVAERNADAGVYLYEADVVDFVSRVIVAYWRVVTTREAVEVQRASMELAERTVTENEARVRVGLLAPVSVLEAQAEAALRKEQLIGAENDLAVARQSLAQLAFYRPEGTFVPRTLEPVDDPGAPNVKVDLDASLQAALADRPEVIASALGIEAKQIQERIASNALLPRLDLVGSYGVNGLSGDTQPIRTTSFISPVDYTTINPKATCQLISVGIYRCTVPLPANRQPPSALDGGPRVAYGSRGEHGGLLSGDFNSYSFGLRLTVPLDNALARSQFTRSSIEREQAEFNHRELLSQVTLEVRQAIADVVAGKERIETSRVAQELAEENLRNQEKRHEVGMATTKDLLDFQTRLTEARFALVRANSDYNISVEALRRAQGALLAHYQIVVQHPGSRSTPWFARF